MSKRINLYFHDDFYNDLVSNAGKRNISKFIEEKLGAIFTNKNAEIESGYKKMSQDKKQMKEMITMANACVEDIGHESW